MPDLTKKQPRKRVVVGWRQTERLKSEIRGKQRSRTFPPRRPAPAD